MFKFNGDPSILTIKIYEDKFKDNSCLRFEIKVDIDKNEIENIEMYKEKFRELLDGMKECIDSSSYNTYKLLLKLLKSEEFILITKNISNQSPILLFPQFELKKIIEDTGVKEYYGEKIISWEIFLHFSNIIIKNKK